jgi:secreted trypsin-like serine protease
VIAPDAVLTAAHCLVNPTTHVGYPPSDFEVGTGTVNIHDAKALHLSHVSGLAVYPSRNYFGDAAVLILATPTTAPSLPLATAADLRDLQPGVGALTAGWGETHNGEANGSGGQLYWGVLVIQSPRYCQAQVKADALVGFDAGEEICAVDPKFKTTDCYGDSGGPLIVEPTRSTVLDVGIDSMGGPGCKPSEASYFTSVDFVDQWIRSVLAEAGR